MNWPRWATFPFPFAFCIDPNPQSFVQPQALEEREHEISALTDKIAELEDLHAEEKEIADALRQQLQDKEAEFLNMGDENANLTNDLKQVSLTRSAHVGLRHMRRRRVDLLAFRIAARSAGVRSRGGARREERKDRCVGGRSEGGRQGD